MLEQWVLENIFGVLVAIEIMWVAGFLGIFIAYFAVKWHFAKARKAKTAAALADKTKRES